ncbi:hypothetical protein [Streptomyces sp. NRRL B-1347]|uniref:hypothetical protein n=1 Tax=Streptomyces sp. NRRL B-1347 TaxID=1476877 RepID=UPI0004CAB864|nr:hypothetical protein [Streptomyces sp. NRRL B-1347]
MTTMWRGPDGHHWEEAGQEFDADASEWITHLAPAAQDSETGRWASTECGAPIQVRGDLGRAGYTEVSADPLAEPRVARLHALLAELLADYHQRTGAPHPNATQLRLSFEDVAALPEQLRNIGRATARQAASSGYNRGARGRR